jgi:hypothetical protein
MEDPYLATPICRKNLRCIDTGLPREKAGCTKKSHDDDHQAHSKIYKVVNCSDITYDL